MDDPKLKALLRFALQHTKSEDAPADSAFKELDKEKKEFLEKALKSITVDVIEELERAITTLESEASDCDAKLAALEVIRGEIDNIDFANSFVKVGGSNTIFKFIDAAEPELRSAATNILAEMAQNNPFCQNHFLERNILQTLLRRLDNDAEEVVLPLVHAISAIITNYESALKQFLENDGVGALLSCFNRSEDRTIARISFLIASLSTANEAVRDEFVQKKAILTLLPLLETTSAEYDSKTENAAHALSKLVKSEKWNPNDAELNNLKAVVNGFISAKQGLPENEDCVAFAQEILQGIES